MDRFGLVYVAALILLLLASSFVFAPAFDPGEPSASAVDIHQEMVGSPEAPASGPATAAVLHSEGRTYRVLVGRDAAGRPWSAAFTVGD